MQRSRVSHMRQDNRRTWCHGGDAANISFWTAGKSVEDGVMVQEKQ